MGAEDFSLVVFGRGAGHVARKAGLQSPWEHLPGCCKGQPGLPKLPPAPGLNPCDNIQVL